MVKKALVLVVLLSLVACSGKNTLTTKKEYDAMGNVMSIEESYDLSDTGMYHKSVSEDSKHKSELAQTKAKEIAGQDLSHLSTDAQAIIKYKQGEEIAGMEVTPYSGKAPTTAADIGKEVAGFIPAIANAGVKGVAVVEAAKTVRAFAEKDSVKIEGDGNQVAQHREDNDQVQAATGTNPQTAPQSQGVEASKETTVEGNGCPEDKPVFYEGTCYSEGSAEERGFPVD